MNMLEVHARALDGGAAVYHEFMLRYRSDSNVVYGIVEGRDDPMFYRGFIEAMLPDNWGIELLPGGGRRNVLACMQLFDWTRFSRGRICFFVDRDLSRFVSDSTPEDDNLYVTDNYSIENDACTESGFLRLLQEAFNITDLSPTEVQALTESYRTAEMQFKEAMAPVMAQVIVWRRNQLKPNLNNVKLKEIVRVTEQDVSTKPDCSSRAALLAKVGQWVQLKPSIDQDVVEIEEEFRGDEGVVRFIRGKYMLWFFVEFALCTHKAISRHIPRFDRPPKPKITLGLGNVMLVLAPRVRCPPSLRAFIERNYLAYLEDRAALRGIERDVSGECSAS